MLELGRIQLTATAHLANWNYILNFSNLAKHAFTDTEKQLLPYDAQSFDSVLRSSFDDVLSPSTPTNSCKNDSTTTKYISTVYLLIPVN